MDAAKKAKRRPMSGAERNAFLRRFWPGILVISVCYACIITFRSYRDYFALDIYKAVLRRNPESWLYLVADFPAGGLSSLIMLAMSRIADNRTAVMVLHGEFTTAKLADACSFQSSRRFGHGLLGIAVKTDPMQRRGCGSRWDGDSGNQSRLAKNFRRESFSETPRLEPIS